MHLLDPKRNKWYLKIYWKYNTKNDKEKDIVFDNYQIKESWIFQFLSLYTHNVEISNYSVICQNIPTMIELQ